MEHLIEDLKEENEPKGSVEVAKDLIVGAGLLKNSIGPLKIQFAGNPRMVELMDDPKYQAPFIDVMSMLYSYVYTDEEMANIKDFYLTPTGQKVQRNAYALGLRAGMVIQDWIADLMDVVEEEGGKFPTKDELMGELDTEDSEGDE
jgi:hypothetical protein